MEGYEQNQLVAQEQTQRAAKATQQVSRNKTPRIASRDQ